MRRKRNLRGKRRPRAARGVSSVGEAMKDLLLPLQRQEVPLIVAREPREEVQALVEVASIHELPSASSGNEQREDRVGLVLRRTERPTEPLDLTAATVPRVNVAVYVAVVETRVARVPQDHVVVARSGRLSLRAPAAGHIRHESSTPKTSSMRTTRR